MQFIRAHFSNFHNQFSIPIPTLFLPRDLNFLIFPQSFRCETQKNDWIDTENFYCNDKCIPLWIQLLCTNSEYFSWLFGCAFPASCTILICFLYTKKVSVLTNIPQFFFSLGWSDFSFRFLLCYFFHNIISKHEQKFKLIAEQFTSLASAKIHSRLFVMQIFLLGDFGHVECLIKA